MNLLAGSNSVLRSKVDRLERENTETQRGFRGSGGSSGPAPGRQAGNPIAEYQLAEQTKQLDTLKQQLAFAEQEVEPFRGICRCTCNAPSC